MPGDDKEQRTENATPKRRKEAREKGNVAKSKEISSVFVMVGSLFTFYFIGSYMFNNMLALTTGVLSQSSKIDLNRQNFVNLFQTLLKDFVMIISPILIVTFIFALVSNILQTGGFIFSIDAIGFKFSKINPIKGFGKIFSKQSLAELIKSIFKISIVGYIAYLTVSGEFTTIPALSQMETLYQLKYLGVICFKMFSWTVLVLLILALIDFAFQKYEFEQSIKMTKEEIKKESKEAEGDPMVKARIRSVQKDIARRRMMQEVPKADVIITNPVRLAVALKYTQGIMGAPKVIAKGSGHVAARIRELARKENIPIVENKPLARTLHKGVKVGAVIPEACYKAVAEVLAYVYRLKRKG